MEEGESETGGKTRDQLGESMQHLAKKHVLDFFFAVSQLNLMVVGSQGEGCGENVDESSHSQRAHLEAVNFCQNKTWLVKFL